MASEMPDTVYAIIDSHGYCIALREDEAEARREHARLHGEAPRHRPYRIAVYDRRPDRPNPLKATNTTNWPNLNPMDQ